MTCHLMTLGPLSKPEVKPAHSLEKCTLLPKLLLGITNVCTHSEAMLCP